MLQPALPTKPEEYWKRMDGGLRDVATNLATSITKRLDLLYHHTELLAKYQEKLHKVFDNESKVKWQLA